MATHWLLYTLIAGSSSALFNTFLRKALKESPDPTAYAWWYECIRLAFFGLLIPFAPNLIFSWVNLGILLVLGLGEFAAIYFYMKMHASNELSISTIVMQLRSIYVPILAFFVLGEQLTLLEWLGIFLIVAGAIVVAFPKSFKVDAALKYTIMAGIFTAISSVTIKLASSFASIPVVTFAFSLPAVILLPLCMNTPLTRIAKARANVVRKNLPASISNLVTMFALVAALHVGSASQTSGIFQGISMISVVVGVLFLKEHDHAWRKLLGAGITTIGILLLV